VTPVEQVKLKRARVGCALGIPTKLALDSRSSHRWASTRRWLDRPRRFLGVYTWCTPYLATYGYLTERGTLVYNGRIDGSDDNFLSSMAWKGGVLLEVDRSGEVVWEVRHPDHHHDGIRLANGNAMLLCLAEIPCDIAQRVPGGRPGTEYNCRMYADYLVEMTTNGRCVWEWRSWEHVEPEEFPIVNLEAARSEWTHGNAVVELADGDLLLRFQLTSTVVIVDQRSGAVVRKIGPPLLNNQHTPSLLPNGNILIFDNGTHRRAATVFSG
jgi:hypothetical protein